MPVRNTLYTFMDRASVDSETKKAWEKRKIEEWVCVSVREERKQWRVNPLSLLTLISPRAEPGSSGLTAAVSQDGWQPAGPQVGDGGRPDPVLCQRDCSVCVCLSVKHVKHVKEEVTFTVGCIMLTEEEREKYWQREEMDCLSYSVN